MKGYVNSAKGYANSAKGYANSAKGYANSANSTKIKGYVIKKYRNL